MAKLRFSFVFPTWVQIFCFSWCCILLGDQSLGQSGAYTQYTIEDGLPTNYVYGVVEDDLGYIWAYTENGLAKFNGSGFEILTTLDGLVGNDIYSMVKGLEGNFFMCSWPNNVSMIHPQTRQIRSFHGLSAGEVTLFEDRVIAGLCELDAHGIVDSIFQPLSETKNSILRYLQLEKDEKLIRNVEKNLLQWSRKDSTRHFSVPSVNTRRDLGRFLSVGKGQGVWTTLSEQRLSLFRFDLAKPVVLNLEMIFGTSVQDALFSSVDGQYVINSERGYAFLDNNLSVEKIYQPRGLERFSLKRLFIDSQGNHWIGSKDGGLFFKSSAAVAAKHFETHKDDSPLIERLVHWKGKYLAISDRLNIYEWTPDGLQLLYTHPTGTNFIDAVVTPKDELILMAFESFLLTENLELKKLSQVPFYSPSHTNDTLRFSIEELRNDIYFQNKTIAFEESQGKYLMGQKSGLYLGDPTTKTLNLIDHRLAQALCWDKKSGTAQIAIGKALYTFSDGQLLPWIEAPDTPLSISALGPDEALIGTENGGCFHLKDGIFERVSDLRFVRKIKKIQDEYWLCSTQGLGLLSYADGQWNEVDRKTTQNGLPAQNIFDAALHNSQIHVATSKGLVAIDRKPMASLASVPLLRTGISNGLGNTLPFDPETNSVELSAKDEGIRVDFELIHYASLNKITYVYRLEPFQKKWTYTTDGQAEYSQLPPGEYSLSFKAIDAFGKTHQSSLPLSIVMHPAWWQTWYAKLGAGLFLGFLVYGIVVWRDKRQLIAVEEKRKLNERFAQLKMSSLRSQMNPHFIFNSLGSIQYYIQTEKVDEADNYLTLFAQLMRRYLDSAIENLISIKNEVALLDEYTKLEMMRFDHQFTTEIRADEEVEMKTDLLPSMIIQPFVENAINHGLPHRKDGCAKLTILFEKKDETLSCSIMDNGIGIANSQKIGGSQHKSRAMQNVRDRIEVLRATGTATVTLATSTLSEDQTYPGTLVLLTFQHIKKDD